ncbi:MAG TPA: hypothetical protein VFV50_12985 [Bdellovibrionales bacterium]|nr:hypothetical protein [Bdellovibrionales bacterium]
MKFSKLLFAVFLASCPAAAQDDGTGDSSGELRQSANPELDNAKTQAEQRFDTADARIQNLDERAGTSRKLQAIVLKLRAGRDATAARLTDLKSAVPANYERLKKEFEASLKRLERDIKRAEGNKGWK